MMKSNLIDKQILAIEINKIYPDFKEESIIEFLTATTGDWDICFDTQAVIKHIKEDEPEILDMKNILNLKVDLEKMADGITIEDYVIKTMSNILCLPNKVYVYFNPKYINLEEILSNKEFTTNLYKVIFHKNTDDNSTPAITLSTTIKANRAQHAIYKARTKYPQYVDLQAYALEIILPNSTVKLETVCSTIEYDYDIILDRHKMATELEKGNIILFKYIEDLLIYVLESKNDSIGDAMQYIRPILNGGEFESVIDTVINDFNLTVVTDTESLMNILILTNIEELRVEE